MRAQVGQSQRGIERRPGRRGSARSGCAARPRQVKSTPWRPLRVGSTQSKRSMPRCDRRRAGPAGARGPSGSAAPRRAASSCATATSSLAARGLLAEAEAAVRVAVEAERGGRARRCARRSAGESRRPARCRRAPGRGRVRASRQRSRPAQRALERRLGRGARRVARAGADRRRPALVERHRDVGAERLLDRDGALGRELAPRAVERRARR